VTAGDGGVGVRRQQRNHDRRSSYSNVYGHRRPSSGLQIGRRQ